MKIEYKDTLEVVIIDGDFAASLVHTEGKFQCLRLSGGGVYGTMSIQPSEVESFRKVLEEVIRRIK